MICHVLPGDSVAREFERTSIDGEPIVCRECLVVGPLDAPGSDAFWAARAAFILSAYGEDEISYQDIVARELARLEEVSSDDEVNLWFEYELFCSVNLWFCLSTIARSGARAFRVHPFQLAAEDRWSGFATLSHEQLTECLDGRIEIAEDDIELGSLLFNAFAARDSKTLLEYADRAEAGEIGNAFPYLGEVLRAAADFDRPQEIVREIMATGRKDLTDVFPQFQKQAGVYGYGDTQVQRLIDRLS